MNDALKLKPINKKAKGVILFLGDGMGISTVTAARILQGQLQGNTGMSAVTSLLLFTVGIFKHNIQLEVTMPCLDAKKRRGVVSFIALQCFLN